MHDGHPLNYYKRKNKKDTSIDKSQDGRELQQNGSK